MNSHVPPLNNYHLTSSVLHTCRHKDLLKQIFKAIFKQRKMFTIFWEFLLIRINKEQQSQVKPGSWVAGWTHSVDKSLGVPPDSCHNYSNSCFNWIITTESHGLQHHSQIVRTYQMSRICHIFYPSFFSIHIKNI